MEESAIKIEKMFREKCECAFLTGSRAFGWSTDKSDFDVCVFAGDKDTANGLISKLGKITSKSEYYDSSKGEILLNIGMVTINPIPLHPLDMVCWYLATRHVQVVAKIDSSFLQQREFKHGVFEMMRGWYKTVLRYKGEAWAKQVLHGFQDKKQ